MESLGKRLTQARTDKGLEFDQVSRETNIARRYLEALEKEDFSVFPGEPYLLGFLRNYCDYLGLPGNDFISAYKNHKIQESPIPLKDLMPKRPITDRLPFRVGISPRVVTISVGLVVIAALIFGSVKLIGALSRPAEPGETVSAVRQAVSYTLDNTAFAERLYAGDSIKVNGTGTEYLLEVESTAPVLKLNTPVGPQLVELGQDLFIDLSGDGFPDVKVFVADLFKSDPTKGADVRISTGQEDLAAAVPITAAAVTETAAAEAAVPVVAASARQTVLFEGGSAYPVTLNATFRGYCLFRYEADRNNRDERYYQKSEQLTVQANNGIRIWASNGNAVKLQIVGGGKTVDLELSRPGEVIVRDIKWIRDEATGRFKFVVMDID